jgi:multisubunit Na+/H+ antiporter MnhG subunit
MSSPHVKVRSPLAVVALSVVTLFVYPAVWYYRVNRELRDYGRARQDQKLGATRPVLSLVALIASSILLVPAFVSLVGAVGRLRAAERLAGRDPRDETPIVLPGAAGLVLAIGWANTSGPASTLLLVAGAAASLVAMALMQARLNEVWRAAERARGSAREGREPGELAPEDERLHGVRALVGVDDLHVGQVAGDVELEQEAVAAEDVARV